MGAHHALAAYRLYASRVPPTSLVVLGYMALVAKDADTEPWWSQGHDTLAVHALGRSEPVTRLDEQANDRAVGRAITPLFKHGAITTDRYSAGRGDRRIQVKYRLWLSEPAPDEKRRPEHRSAPDGNRPVDSDPAPDGNRPALGLSTGRKVSQHRTESVAAPDGNRLTKEYEEYEEQLKDEEQSGDRRTPRSGSALIAAANGNQIDDSASGPETERYRQLDALTAMMRDGPAAAGWP